MCDCICEYASFRTCEQDESFISSFRKELEEVCGYLKCHESNFIQIHIDNVTKTFTEETVELHELIRSIEYSAYCMVKYLIFGKIDLEFRDTELCPDSGIIKRITESGMCGSTTFSGSICDERSCFSISKDSLISIMTPEIVETGKNSEWNQYGTYIKTNVDLNDYPEEFEKIKKLVSSYVSANELRFLENILNAEDENCYEPGVIMKGTIFASSYLPDIQNFVDKLNDIVKDIEGLCFIDPGDDEFMMGECPFAFFSYDFEVASFYSLGNKLQLVGCKY